MRPPTLSISVSKDQVVGVEILGIVDRIDRGELRSVHFELA